MLVRSRFARLACWLIFAVVVAVLIVTPIVVTALTAFSTSWNSVLPSGLTADHMAQSVSAENLQSISVSIQTAIVASALAVLVGTWAALASRKAPARLRGIIDTAYHLPVAVPSVVIGFGVLIAFSKPPLVLNGTPTIVILVQSLLVLSFAFSMVSAAAKSLDPALDRVADSLGASPTRTLLTVTLPLLAPRHRGIGRPLRRTVHG